MNVKVKKMRKNAKLPTYGSEGAGCFDLYSAVTTEVTNTRMIPLGIAVEVPEGHIMVIVPRSSIGAKTPLRMSNSIGIIDSDYRGEISALYEAKAGATYVIHEGDRIAQGFIMPVPAVTFEEVEELSDTKRGSGGFGSTGK